MHGKVLMLREAMDADDGVVRRAASTLRLVPTSATDPTVTVSSEGDVVSLTRTRQTAEGPASLTVSVGLRRIEAVATGGEAARVLDSWRGWVGLADTDRCVTPRHRAVADALRRHPDLRLVATGAVYEEMLVAVLGQRITSTEAGAQWRRLCADHGELDPASGLRCAPSPARLADLPYHRLHRLGIERRRAESLSAVGDLFARRPDLLTSPGALRGDLGAVLARSERFLRGVGPWTAAVVLGRAHGDPDALAVGDWHLKNLVAHALTGRARGTDEEMVDALEIYRGQRHRVVTLLAADGQRAPRLGPRRRSVDIGRM